MPEKKTLERARRDAREGKSPSTQAGEFVRSRQGDASPKTVAPPQARDQPGVAARRQAVGVEEGTLAPGAERGASAQRTQPFHRRKEGRTNPRRRPSPLKASRFAALHSNGIDGSDSTALRSDWSHWPRIAFRSGSSAPNRR